MTDIIVPSRPARPIVVEGNARRLPPGGTTGQALIKASDSDFATVWGTATAAAAWGAITGTLASQTDLQSALDAKQATLVSGVNIKTLNGSTILGSGDLVVSSSIADGDKGDITVSGSGATWTIDAAAVSLSKMADLATSTILGRATAGTGVPEALSAAQVRTLLGLATVATSGSAADLGTGTLPAARLPAFGSGDVSFAASGGAGTIAAGAVTLAKQANMATASVVYRKTAGSGAPETQTLATLKTDLGLTGTNSGDQTITLTSDVTGSGTGSFATTIAANAVTNAKRAQLATARIRGRVTAGTGDTEDLTGTQATTLLDTFTSALKGLAPASGGGTTNFLRADGTWAAPGGGGGVADGDKGDITVSGSGATWTIDNAVVTNAKLADMPTARFKGRTTAGTGEPEDLTAAQATALLDTFVASGGSHKKGLVPDPPASSGTAKFLREDATWAQVTESLIIAVSDEITALTTGTAKVTFRMPYAFTLTAVRASLTTAQASGSIFTVDINEAGSTILSTKLTIDNTEKTSTTASAAAVISDTALADDAEITIDIDQIGDGTAKGLKVYLIGYQS